MAALIVRKALWFSGPPQEEQQPQQQQQQQVGSSGAGAFNWVGDMTDDDDIDLTVVDAVEAEYLRRKSAASELAADDLDLTVDEVAAAVSTSAFGRQSIVKPPLRGEATQWLGKTEPPSREIGGLPSQCPDQRQPLEASNPIAPPDLPDDRSRLRDSVDPANAVPNGVLSEPTIGSNPVTLGPTSIVGGKRPPSSLGFSSFGGARRKPTSLQ